MNKQVETTMSRAFAKAGVNPNFAALDVALSLFRNNGGTYAQALARCRHAFADELPGEGHDSSADEANSLLPSARQSDGDDGAKGSVPQGHTMVASPSPHDRAAGAGHSSSANNGQGEIVRPAREHTRPKRGLDAIRRANLILLINGIDIRNFTLGACRSEAHRKGKEHYVLSVIAGLTKHLPDTMHVKDAITDDDLKSIVRQGEAFSNAH
jgi:hypothetical protein